VEAIRLAIEVQTADRTFIEADNVMRSAGVLGGISLRLRAKLHAQQTRSSAPRGSASSITQ
jgi:hypothetical protein